MNKLQGIFKIEERGHRNHSKEKLLVILYCLFIEPRQAKFIKKWLASLKPGHSPIDDKIPWLTYTGVESLASLLSEDMKVFEYGSGGSTLYLAPRVKEVVSVEHDKDWYKIVKRQVDKYKWNNVRLILKKPKILATSVAKHEYFRSIKEKNRSFKDYVLAINSYPDEYFDLVIIDGRARVACVREAYDKTRNKGYLILDNSDRKDYNEAFLFMKRRSNQVKRCFGIIAYTTTLMETTIWKVKKTDQKYNEY